MKTAARPSALLVLVVLLCPALLFGAAPERWDMAALMEALAGQGPHAARFVEHRQVGLLTHPLTSTGTLRYLSPTSFVKIVDQPTPERYQVEGDSLTITRGGQAPQRIDMAEYPPLQAFIGAIRDTLAGDRQALEQRFELELSGSAAAWRLSLRPRDRRLRSHVQTIYVDGSGGRIKVFEVRETNGDSSVLRLIERHD